mmetsp:Transcript_82091/g.214183  ORF Transcript_82091/g.214183 Transcript_82091/m.214183 type:complete len:86 (+) Transcript_82091:1036-1293(+)
MRFHRSLPDSRQSSSFCAYFCPAVLISGETMASGSASARRDVRHRFSSGILNPPATVDAAVALGLPPDVKQRHGLMHRTAANNTT